MEKNTAQLRDKSRDFTEMIFVTVQMWPIQWVCLKTEKFHSKDSNTNTGAELYLGELEHEPILIPYSGVEETHTNTLELNEPKRE